MAKKKNRSQGDGSTSAASAAAAAQATKKAAVTVTVKSSVMEVLGHALSSLDEVAQESHRRRQRQALNTAACAASTAAAAAASRKRGREEDGDAATAAPAAPSSSSLSGVYAAMALPYYETIETAVAAYGLQLLPVLHEVVRRVGLAASTPALASPESWETAAMLCAYFGAGPAARMVEELLEGLVRARGVFFFDAPCVTGEESAAAAAASGGNSNGDGQQLLARLSLAEVRGDIAQGKDAAATTSSNSNSNAQQHQQRAKALEAAARKLAALAGMLTAVGPYVPSALLQRAALRFTQEVVEGGILSLDAAVAAAIAATPHGQQGGAAAAERAAAARGQQSRIFWRVPAACQAPCLEVLDALLMLRGMPAELAVCAGRTVAEVMASLGRGALVCPPPSTITNINTNQGKENGSEKAATASGGGTWEAAEAQCSLWPSFVLYRTVVAAAVRVRQTLSLLRHPAAVPHYRPPTYAEERVASKILVAAPAVVMEEVRPSANGIAAAVVVVATAAAAAPQQSVGVHPAMATPLPRSDPVVAAVEEKKPAPVIVTAAPAPYVKESLGAMSAVRPSAPQASGNAAKPGDGDDESIPDIDMDDD